MCCEEIGSRSDQRTVLGNLKMTENTKEYTLKNICSCSMEQQLQVLKLRNQLTVRKSKFSDHLIDLNEHLSWISTLLTDNKRREFVLLKGGNEPIGVVSVKAIDTLHKKTDLSLYVLEQEQNGLVELLEYKIVEFVFNRMKLDKLNCEVIQTNTSALTIHKRFGFIEEGLRRSDIIKEGKRMDVYLLGLTKEDWEVKRLEIKEYVTQINPSELSIEFSEETSKEKMSIIDEIREARAKNNINWMALLQLSMEHHPQVAQPIISEILKLDREISNLATKLLD